MPKIEYRLYLGHQPATRAQLDSVEEITVEQEVDMAWEARLQIPVVVDDKGRWNDEKIKFINSFSRVRVEIKVGDKPFVPLIDGAVVGYDSHKSLQPGQSAITAIVQDDSVYLNREERLSCFDDKTDHEIAEELFGDVEEIASTEVEETPPLIDDLPAVTEQRGTAMQILRSLARRQGMHAYVLPGEEPGESVGYFKSFPTSSSELPPLILLGADRNVETLNMTYDAQGPSIVQAFSLQITDKVVMNSQSSFRNLDLLGAENPFSDENEAQTTTRLASPGLGSVVDPARRAAVQTQRSSYAFNATGSVLGDCYAGVLQPYRTVSVRAINQRLSGDYLIHQVTHTLTRSNYSQSFTLKRNARSEGAGSDFSDPVGNIF